MKARGVVALPRTSPLDAPRARRRLAALALMLAACEPAPPVAAPRSHASSARVASAAPTRTSRGPRAAPNARSPSHREEPPRDTGAPSTDAPPPIDPPATVIVTVSDECGLVLDQIYFERGSAALRDAQRPVLDATADMFRCFLRTGEITKWQVIGNADDTERDPSTLSRSRAQAVADALIARGVDAATLDVSGVGTAEPQDRRRTPTARAKNRRVFFVVLQRRDSSP